MAETIWETLARMAEGPMPTMPAAGATNMPNVTPSNTGGEEEEMAEEPDEGRSNWSKLDKMRNMQRYGSISGREFDRQRARLTSPNSIFNQPGPGEAERNMRRASAAMSSIPQGQDVAPQPNPLMSPSRAGRQTMRPRSGWEDLLSGGDDEEP